jgi:hypothetical protein
MLAPSPIPQAAPKRELSADHIRELLAASGYGNADAAVRERYSLPAGCGISLQFGEPIAENGNGVPYSTLRCNLVLNGSEAHSGHATRWTVDKAVRILAGGDRFSLAIEVKLVLGSRVFLDDILTYGGDAFRHLRLLIADARATLSAMPGADEAADSVDGPALRIEARYIGDLAAGRSGFVGGHAAGDGPPRAPAAPPRRRIASRERRMIGAACDCVSDELLPGLARSMRKLIARETASMRRPAPCEIESKRHPASTSHATSAAHAQPFDVAELAETLSCEPPP